MAINIILLLPFRPYSSESDPHKDADMNVNELLMRLATDAVAWASDPPKKQASGLDSTSEKLLQWAGSV